MNRTIGKWLLGSIPFITILTIWSFFYYANPDSRWLIHSPIETAGTFFSLATDYSFLQLLGTSALNLIPPFIVAVVIAITLGTLIGIDRTVRKIFYPFLSALYPIPSLAWLPFALIVFGFTQETIWFVIFLSSFMKIIYSVIGGVQNVNINHIFVAKNFGCKKREIVFQVLLPSALPQILTGIRIGFGSAWRSLVGAEMLVVTLGGLGKFIWLAQWYFEFDKVIAGVAVIALFGILIEGIVFKKLEKATLEKWGFTGRLAV